MLLYYILTGLLILSLSSLSLSPLFSLSLFLLPFIIRLHAVSVSTLTIFLVPSFLINSHLLIFAGSHLVSPPSWRRPHSYDSQLGSGPCRHRRCRGSDRLHSPLPPHRPWQIPHQTQRSCVQTDTRRATHVYMHECTQTYSGINMDKQKLSSRQMHTNVERKRNANSPQCYCYTSDWKQQYVYFNLKYTATVL